MERAKNRSAGVLPGAGDVDSNPAMSTPSAYVCRLATTHLSHELFQTLPTCLHFTIDAHDSRSGHAPLPVKQLMTRESRATIR
jgi:hypothetical protein